MTGTRPCEGRNQDLANFHLLLLLPLSFRDSELRRALGLCPLRNEATMKQVPRKERPPDPRKVGG